MTFVERPELAVRTFYLNGLYIVFILLASLSLGNLNTSAKVGDVAYYRYQACRLSPTTKQLIYTLDDACPDMLTSICKAESDANALTISTNCTSSWDWDHEGDMLAAATSTNSAKNLLDQLAECDSVANRTAECFPFSSESYSNKSFVAIDADKDDADALLHLTNISISLIVINVVLLIHSILIHFEWMIGMDYHFILSPLFSVVHIGLFGALIGLVSAPHAQAVPTVYFGAINLLTVAVVGLVITLIDALLVNLLIWVFRKDIKWFRYMEF